MKYIGVLHSVGNPMIPEKFNGIHFRQYINQYNGNIVEYMNKKPQDADSRQWNIYQVANRTYHQQLQEIRNSDLTLLCPLNVEGDISHFYKLKEFVKELINYTFNMGHKNIAIVALNEPFEYLNLDSYYGYCLNIRNGILESKRPDIPIILGNEKIRTSTEQHYYDRMITDYIWKLHKNTYIGFQSLGTTTTKMYEYFKKAEKYNWEVIDVEFGDEHKEIDHYYDKEECLNNLKSKFNLELIFNIKGCFLVFPYQKQNAYYNYISFNYIDDNLNIIKKRKAWYIYDYILMKFKKQGEFMRIANYYVKGDFGDKVIDLIQDMLKQLGYLQKPINFGIFDEKTEQAVLNWQRDNGCVVNGVVSKWQIWRMIEQQSNPESKMRQLIIYCS